MKTTAKWISGNQFVIDNNRHFRLAIIDQETSADMEPSCLDLLMMGFAGCITSAFRTKARQRAIPYKELDTELSIDFTRTPSEKMTLTVCLQTSSGAPLEILNSCLEEAIQSSMPGILFKNVGVNIQQKVILNSLADVKFY